MEKTLIVMTGGTIDSAYDPENGTPENVPSPPFSAIPHALKTLGYGDESYDLLNICYRDSKQVNRLELHQIAQHLAEHPEYTKVMIIHGTDTEPRNGRYMDELLQHISPNTYRVVFCGSMRPLRKQAKGLNGAKEDIFLSSEETDAYTNLETAWEGLKSDAPGVFLTDGKNLRSVHEVEKAKDIIPGEGGNTVQNARFVERLSNKPTPGTEWLGLV